MGSQFPGSLAGKDEREEKGREEGKERGKTGRADLQKLEEAELEKGVMEEGSSLSPVDNEKFLREVLVFPLRLGLPKSGLHASPLDFAPQGKGLVLSHQTVSSLKQGLLNRGDPQG